MIVVDEMPIEMRGEYFEKEIFYGSKNRFSEDAFQHVSLMLSISSISIVIALHSHCTERCEHSVRKVKEGNSKSL